MKKSLWLISVGAIALGSSVPVAWAQDSGSAVDSENVNIIVTATRRASPLSDVPIAVSAVTSQAMQNSGATDIRALNQLAPSLLLSSTGTEANASARIRGIGTVGDNPGLESSVAVFIDGVYRSRTGAGLNELGEIERVEVLRGPQGTLFGRNASAGLINIISKAPEFTLGGKAEVTYGNYDYWRLAGRVTGPVTDKLALSLDGVWSKRDGFYDLVNASGAKVGETNDRDRYFLRGQALFQPNDALSIRLIGDYTHRDESCCGAPYIETRERRPVAGGGYSTAPFNRIAAILAGQGSVFGADPYDRDLTITAGRNYVSKLKDWGVSGEINYDLGGTKLTSITAYRDYKSQDYGDYDYGGADLLYRDPNTHRQFKTFTQELRAQGSAFNDVLDWLVGGYYAHEKLTLEDNIVFGADYGRFAACRLMAGASVNSNLTAAQLAACGSGLATQALITGTQAQLNGGLILAGVPALQAGAISTGLGNGLRALAAIPSGTGDVASLYHQKSENWALFTHNIVHITSQLDLTLGLRYTHESKRFSADFNNNNATCAALQASSLPAIATNAQLGSAAALAGGILTLGCLGNGSTGLNALDLNDKISDGEFSGTAVLSWKPIQELLVYGSYSKGYKAGGYNLDRFQLGSTGLNAVPAVFAPRTNADVTSLRFAAEKVDAFEVGLKYTQPKWSANIAAFRQEFKNFQLNTFNGTSFVVQNINGCDGALTAARTCAGGDVGPGLISQGVELELSATPARNVRVAGGFTYARAKFANRLVGSSNGTVPLDPALFLLPGSINSQAPEVVTTVSAAWTPSLGSNGLSALFYVDGRMSSDFNTGSDLFPEKRQDGYAVFNARVGIRGPQQRWAVEFWGQNIFNQDYSQVAFSTPLQSSSPSTSTTGQFALGAPMANQLISAYLAEPRTYGITLRGSF
ncbi:TonB-denpendent receptor [Sphingobium indicum IP26]|uniref:TonB-dependent receptor n=1 Tax=Sphingobium indicum F2 TaxID=1450518 RepID=A0A8E0WS65_9SPHN|nr:MULTISPECIES: TonB-dependent receptor [Sphingobium]EPR18994.1 TonB-denpendent receptor [Sphingobium indicum IP26]EQA99899.1 TonB-denpendent receptor [Sphingobium sp. HDIP04]KER36431.1 TonB-dependent receptor [Sphingobium indicum F2]